MRLTKLVHACVRLEKDQGALVIDPSAWAGPGALDGAGAVLVTHEHFDHFDPDGLRAAMTANPGLELWANPSVAGQFAEFTGRVHSVRAGQEFSAAGFGVRVYGEEHALIHHDIPLVANTGFLIDETVFHPGDALTVPDEEVPVLLLPVSAPWLKIGEMIDYTRAVRPRQGIAIHDALYSDVALGLLPTWLNLAGDPIGAKLTRVDPGTSVDL